MIGYGVNIFWKPLQPLKLLVLVTSSQIVVKNVSLAEYFVGVPLLVFFLELSDACQVFVFPLLVNQQS